MTLKAGHTTLLKSGNADADPALGGSGNISRTVTLTNLRGDGALTIQRVAGNGPPAGQDAGRLINEYRAITRGGTLLFDSATVVFECDAANRAGPSASELKTAFAEGTIRGVNGTRDGSPGAGRPRGRRRLGGGGDCRLRRGAVPFSLKAGAAAPSTAGPLPQGWHCLPARKSEMQRIPARGIRAGGPGRRRDKE
jgi:hypothetical protein